MSSYRHSKQLRRTSNINIVMLLLSLVVLNGHCAAAYASASSVSMPEHHQMADASNMAMMDHHSQPDADCVEMHDEDPTSTLITSSLKQQKDKQDDLKPLVAAMNKLPEPRAGPAVNGLANCSADFSTPPLYYSLCVLRL